jgi:hypothetical protein
VEEQLIPINEGMFIDRMNFALALRSSSGRELLDAEGVTVMRESQKRYRS